MQAAFFLEFSHRQKMQPAFFLDTECPETRLQRFQLFSACRKCFTAIWKSFSAQLKTNTHIQYQYTNTIPIHIYNSARFQKNQLWNEILQKASHYQLKRDSKLKSAENKIVEVWAKQIPHCGIGVAQRGKAFELCAKRLEMLYGLEQARGTKCGSFWKKFES